MQYYFNDNRWLEPHLGLVQFLLLIIAAENTIFLLTLLYFLFF